MRGGDGLFEVEPVEKKRPMGPAAVDKTFRAFDPHQVLLLPPSLDDWLPEDHLARFVADLVDEVLKFPDRLIRHRDFKLFAEPVSTPPELQSACFSIASPLHPGAQ